MTDRDFAAELSALHAELATLKARRVEVVDMRQRATETLARVQAERGTVLLSGDKRAADKNGNAIAEATAALRDASAMLSAIDAKLATVVDSIIDAELAGQIAEVTELETVKLPDARRAAADALRLYQERQSTVETLRTQMFTIVGGAGGVTKAARRAELMGGV